jgi:hypothetical protein
MKSLIGKIHERRIELAEIEQKLHDTAGLNDLEYVVNLAAPFDKPDAELLAVFIQLDNTSVDRCQPLLSQITTIMPFRREDFHIRCVHFARSAGRSLLQSKRTIAQ